MFLNLYPSCNWCFIITISPIITSYLIIFFLKNIGSIKAENNDEVDKQITETEIEETLIDLKKKIQCNVTILPTPKKFKNCFLSILNNSFLYTKI